MKKLLGLLSVGIIAVGLAGCGDNSSPKDSSNTSETTAIKLTKQDLRNKYANTNNAQADAYNAMLDNNEGKISNSSYSVKLQDAIDKVKGQNENLDATSTNRSAAKKLIKFNNLGAKTLLDLQNNSNDLTKDMKNQSRLNDKVRPEINAPHPAKLNEAIARWSNAVASQPHVSGNSIVTKDYTIKITKTVTTPESNNGGTDIVIYYDFTNNSSSKNIMPDAKFMESDVTQENDTSIVSLRPGSPENLAGYDNLYDATTQEVKPGATIQCVASYILDNVTTPVKYEANDDHFNKIGTITLQL